MNGIRVLVIEDDDEDFLLIRRFCKSVPDVNLTRAKKLQEGAAHLGSDNYDLILLDLSLPDMTGLALVDKVRELSPGCPIVILTGTDDEETALGALRKGAYDYLVKGPSMKGVLPKTIRYANESARYQRDLEKAKSELEEQVRKATDKLELAHQKALRSERLAAIGQMVTGIAHESRNALQRIQAGVNRLMRRHKGEETSVAVLQSIEESVDDLSHLYETVKDYAKPLSLKIEEVPPAAMISMLEERVANGKTGSFKIYFEEKDESCVLLIDQRAIFQVFRNIVENACQAAKGQHTDILFTTALSVDRKWVTITITDNGPGISSTLSQQLFTPFFSTKQRGTGLGMAISKRIVEEHGGSISVVSCKAHETYKNVTFTGLSLTMSLPCRHCPHE